MTSQSAWKFREALPTLTRNTSEEVQAKLNILEPSSAQLNGDVHVKAYLLLGPATQMIERAIREFKKRE